MIKIYNDDCFNVFPQIEDGSIDAIIADPPYETTCCNWDTIIPFKPMWKELKRIIKGNGAIEYLVKTYTNKNDTVLDFCMGSGTTLEACKKLNRDCIGIEISKEYCEIAQKRLDSIDSVQETFLK